LIKKLLTLVMAVLALNFLAVAGGVGFLVATGKLDKAKVHAVRELIAGTPDAATTQPSTQPGTGLSTDASTTTAAQESQDETPMMRLRASVRQAAGRTAMEQFESQQTAVDAQLAVVDLRQQELEAQRRQIERARAELQTEREKLAKQQSTLTQQLQEQQKLASDEGFQKSLLLYKSMQPKRVKAIFALMDDTTVVRYLQSMEPRQAAGVLKEFKSPEETIRARTLLEKVRQAQQATAE